MTRPASARDWPAPPRSLPTCRLHPAVPRSPRTRPAPPAPARRGCPGPARPPSRTRRRSSTRSPGPGRSHRALVRASESLVLPGRDEGVHVKGPAGVLALVLAETVAGAAGLVFLSPLWKEVRRGFFKLTGIIVLALSAGMWAGVAAA